MLRSTDKPVLINWPTSPDDNSDVVEFLETSGVPVIMAPGRTVHALAALNAYARKKAHFEKARARLSSRVVAPQTLDLAGMRGTLGEHRSKLLLKAYGVPVVEEAVLSPDEIDRLTASPLPFPLAVKIESADIPHKTEAGVVRLGVQDLDALKRAAGEVLSAARRYKADARIEGILVQQMASGLEVMIGAVNDPFFGPTVAFGLGGIFVELLRDVTHRFAPFGVEVAREMIAEPKGAALLRGYRGGPALDVDALAQALSRVSLLIADHADRIAEIDVNPLFVRPAGEGVLAADSLVVLRDG
jgi:acetyltransferase